MTSLDNLNKLKIIPDPLKDQFFLLDESFIKKTVDVAKLNKKDVVLEIGAGTGNLTRELAHHAGRVITFEIDTRFKTFLSRRNLPKNVEIHWENAWGYIKMHGKFKKKKEYNKVVCNPPYSFIEPFLHNLTFLQYDKVILLVPMRFLKKTQKWGVFGSFFEPKVLFTVPKEKFYPVPRTDSVLIELVKLPDPIETKNLGRFLRQYMYQHEGQLVKNSLVEGLIKYNKIVFGKIVTKNEAREIISKANLSTKDLNQTPGTSQLYEEVGQKFKAI